MGGGAGLAIGCDMTVVATDLKFGYPEMRHSIVPAIVMTGLQRQLGRKIAFELFSTRPPAWGGRGPWRWAWRTAWCRTGQRCSTWRWRSPLAGPRRNPAAMAATKALFHRVADLPYDAAMAAGRDVNALMRGFRDP